MDLQRIVKGVKKKLGNNILSEYVDNKGWKFYTVIAGYYESIYFDLYFRESHSNEKSITIITNCESPEAPAFFTNIIKNIEPSAVMSYSVNGQKRKKHWSENKAVTVDFSCFSEKEYEQLEQLTEANGNGDEIQLQIQAMLLDSLKYL